MLHPASTAFIFPGQGSQMVGMGQDFAHAYPVARATFAEADDILQQPFSRLLFEGPADSLDATHNTQPALYVCSVAIWRVLAQALPAVQPGFAAGHSLGELTALTCAGALSFADGLRLVRRRGELMHEAGAQHPGAMAALLNVDVPAAEALCAAARAATGGVLVIANDNCPGQVVISGDIPTLEAALELGKTMNVKRAIRLAVSVATHSPLMSPAQAAFNAVVEQTAFQPPAVPVYANVSARPLRDVASIRAELEAQLTQPVRWRELTTAMIDDGAQTFIEIGTKNVLTGLLRRIDKDKTAINLDTVAAFDIFMHTSA
ncbi:MAG: ACP S-malonyltransferase [Anaerolineae bacterium]|nr:ACP S-malonyltransferase [Anaerolineae bacterium]